MFIHPLIESMISGGGDGVDDNKLPLLNDSFNESNLLIGWFRLFLLVRDFVSESILLQYAADWQPSKPMLEDKVDEITDTFNQAVHLLWNLW